MTSGPVRWLAPVAASAAVLAVVVVPGVLADRAGQRGGGPSPDRTEQRLPRPEQLVLPDPMPHEGRDSRIPPGVLITGYHGAGHDLTLFYRVGPRSDCSTEVRPPRVVEQSDSVSVRLLRAPPMRPEETCTGQSMSSSVRVRLADPMAGRQVQDMARRGAVVPVERPVAAAR